MVYLLKLLQLGALNPPLGYGVLTPTLRVDCTNKLQYCKGSSLWINRCALAQHAEFLIVSVMYPWVEEFCLKQSLSYTGLSVNFPPFLPNVMNSKHDPSRWRSLFSGVTTGHNASMCMF